MDLDELGLPVEPAGHDQLMKELLTEAFPEFIALFYPHVAEQIDFTTLKFLDKETFSDLPDGEQRTADIVAQVQTKDGAPELIVIHIEIEAQKRSTFGQRMAEYYMMLYLRHRKPIFPVVVFLSSGAGGLVTETYRQTLFGEDVFTFCYHAIGLRDLPFAEYIEKPNPLAPMFAIVMRDKTMSAVDRLIRCASLLDQFRQNDARRALMIHFVAKYASLSGAQEIELRERLSKQEEPKVSVIIEASRRQLRKSGLREDLPELLLEAAAYFNEHMEPHVRQKAEQEGREKGLREGRHQGQQEGRQEGRQEVQRANILRLTEKRFGLVPEPLQTLVGQVREIELLDALLDQVFVAQSPEEIGLSLSPLGASPSPSPLETPAS